MNDINYIRPHINHGKRRVEAKRDELFAENFSKKLGIECFVLNADIPQIAKDTNVSEETASRNVRYFFNKLCEKYDIKTKLVTAHNRNDNAETLFMNFMH